MKTLLFFTSQKYIALYLGIVDIVIIPAIYGYDEIQPSKILW